MLFLWWLKEHKSCVTETLREREGQGAKEVRHDIQIVCVKERKKTNTTQ